MVVVLIDTSMLPASEGGASGLAHLPPPPPASNSGGGDGLGAGLGGRLGGGVLLLLLPPPPFTAAALGCAAEEGACGCGVSGSTASVIILQRDINAPPIPVSPSSTTTC